MTAQSSPRNVLLTPDFYNASEGNSTAVQFTCTVPKPAHIGFYVDDTLLYIVLQEPRGINAKMLNGTVAVLYMLPLLVNHNSTVVCFDVLNSVSSFSSKGVLMVQGLLSAPPALTIMNSTSPSSLLLSWSPPFTLDLTDQKPDIIGYRVCFNLSFLHCVLTQDISYTYPNVRLPLLFSVTPLNVVGDGNSSFATHQPCTAAPDFMTVDELMLQVSLSTGGNFSVNASFRLPPQTTCYDAYQLVLGNSFNSSLFSIGSPILLPSITDRDRQMVQVLHEFANLAENTIYSVSLLASNTNGNTSVTGNGFLISTYDIQAVSLNEEGPGSMKLTCVFLANSAAQGCRLTLCKLEDEGYVALPCKEVILTQKFPMIILEGLVEGVYMITLVEDLEEDGNLSVVSDLTTLGVKKVVLTESQPATTSSTFPFSIGSEGGMNPPTPSNIGIIIGSVGAALVVLILVVLVLVLILIYFEKKERFLSCKARSHRTTITGETQIGAHQEAEPHAIVVHQGVVKSTNKCPPSPTYAEVVHVTMPKKKTVPRDETCILYSELCIDNVPSRKSTAVKNGGVKVEELDYKI